jgi:hypothetical protein
LLLAPFGALEVVAVFLEAGFFVAEPVLEAEDDLAVFAVPERLDVLAAPVLAELFFRVVAFGAEVDFVSAVVALVVVAALAGARLRAGFVASPLAASELAASAAGFAGAFRARVFGALVGFVSLDFAKISLPGKRCSNFNVHVNGKMQAQISSTTCP